MDKQQNIEERAGDAEGPQESGAASPGRGGRMSRQRKAAAVLRLLRGEDLESVSRSLGVTAATLSGWRDAFLTASEASLSSRPLDADALESGRLKAKLGGMLIERSCGRPRSPPWRRAVPPFDRQAVAAMSQSVSPASG